MDETKNDRTYIIKEGPGKPGGEATLYIIGKEGGNDEAKESGNGNNAGSDETDPSAP